MVIDSKGKYYEYKTLQFYGLAYGDSNVSLTATINGTTIFSGEVPTINTPIPLIDLTSATILFSIDNSTLFPTNWSGSYPMSITVTGGYGVVFDNIYCNYMPPLRRPAIMQAIMENSSIVGNVLTVGTVSSGTVDIGQQLIGTDVLAGTFIQSGSGANWIVNHSQIVPNTTITGILVYPGTADEYQPCYNGRPVNSENTPDPRSSVTIDSIGQVPPFPKSGGVWNWTIPNGSTITYNLNVSEGLCAQS